MRSTLGAEIEPCLREQLGDKRTTNSKDVFNEQSFQIVGNVCNLGLEAFSMAFTGSSWPRDFSSSSSSSRNVSLARRTEHGSSERSTSPRGLQFAPRVRLL